MVQINHIHVLYFFSDESFEKEEKLQHQYREQNEQKQLEEEMNETVQGKILE